MIGPLRVRWRAAATGRFETSPVIAGGLFMPPVLKGNSLAIRLASGRDLWRQKFEVGFSAAPSVDANRLFVGNEDGVFFAVETASGRVVWKFSAEGPIDSPANVVHGRSALRLGRWKPLLCGCLEWLASLEIHQ